MLQDRQVDLTVVHVLVEELQFQNLRDTSTIFVQEIVDRRHLEVVHDAAHLIEDGVAIVFQVDLQAIAEEAVDFSFGFTDAEESMVTEEAMDFPFGFADGEESTFFSLVLRSVEIGDLPVFSIAMTV